jgi:hypothetical protein
MGQVAVDVAFFSRIHGSVSALGALAEVVAEPIGSEGRACVFPGYGIGISLSDEAAGVALLPWIDREIPALGALALIGNADESLLTSALLVGKNKPRIALLSELGFHDLISAGAGPRKTFTGGPVAGAVFAKTVVYPVGIRRVAALS